MGLEYWKPFLDNRGNFCRIIRMNFKCIYSIVTFRKRRSNRRDLKPVENPICLNKYSDLNSDIKRLLETTVRKGERLWNRTCSLSSI